MLPKEPNSWTLWESGDSCLEERNKISFLSNVILWWPQLHILNFRPQKISYPTWEWEGVGTEIFIFTAHYIILGWWQVLITTVIPTHDYIKNTTEIEIVVGCLGFSLKNLMEESTAKLNIEGKLQLRAAPAHESQSRNPPKAIDWGQVGDPFHEL